MLAALLASIAVGCGNDPHPPGETARRVLYNAIQDDPKSLDPGVAYFGPELVITDLIYPAYFQYHYLKRNPYVLALDLGAAPPRRAAFRYAATQNGRRVTKQGESWTFRIRRGLYFQDDPCFPGGKGREITAFDFLTSFRRMADPRVPSPVLSWVDQKIVGFAAYVARNRERVKHGRDADYEAPVAGLQANPRDLYTFRIVLNQPYPQLRYLMTMHATSPLPREALVRYGAGFAWHPVGSGPYVLAEYRPRERIVLRRNPNRYREPYPREGTPGDREAGLLRDAGRPLPLADEIIYVPVREAVTAWNLFLQGYLDLSQVTQENYQQTLRPSGDLSEEMTRRGIRLLRYSGPFISAFLFNMRDPLVGGYTPRQRKLRQALSLAIDAQAFIDLFAQGHGRPAQSLVPPGVVGYEPGYRNRYRQYNPERALRLLAEAGYPGGIDPDTGQRLRIFYDNAAVDAAGRQQVALVTKQLAAIGVELASRSWRYPVWLDQVQRGQFQLTDFGWSPDYPDAENFLFLLYGPNRSPGPNRCSYDRPEFNRLYVQMRAMDDGPQRLALLRRMRAIVEEDCPWIPLSHQDYLFLAHAWISNANPHPIAWNGDKYLGVDGARRARLQAEWNRPMIWPAVATGLLIAAGTTPALITARRRARRRVRRSDGGKKMPPG